MKPIIRQLPSSLVNKIAAGEVIERPASVVKELLENCIDAGATSIELAIESGGLELIRISDNGCGIAPDQMLLAVASHATSKLQTADDLFDVHTLGFRGEALASIAEVSHLTIRSRTEDADSGVEFSVRGGEASPLAPIGCPVGTTIEVRNLFFNTPVRLKFLRTPQTEAGHISEAFTRIALAFPQVQMSMISGNRMQTELPTTELWSDRIRVFFGDEVAGALIAVESAQEGIQLSGYVADPSVSRSNNRMQYLYLNGRHIRDRSLQHALGEAYRGLLMVGRFPVCFLRLSMPAHQVDVNVHPTKMEVRFLEGGKIYSQLLQTLRHRFLTSDLTARARNVPGPMPDGLRRASLPEEAQGAVVLPETDRTEERWRNHAERASQVTPNAGMAARQLGFPDSLPPFRPFIDSNSPLANRTPNDGSDSLPSDVRADAAMDRTSAASHLGFQVHNRYLVTQDEQGMVVVDQHALHERVLYEQLRERTSSRNLETQKLLVPEPVDLTPQEAAAAMDARELLLKIGIEIEPFGGDTILLTSYPAMLANMRPAEVLRQVLEPLLSGGKQPSARDVLDELLHMLACKAAIKAGDKLAPAEITALLEQRYHYQDTHHCPHGRPTALFFSREQLDKMFKRT